MNKIKFDLNDRTAVITGGAQGFGLDIAKTFLNSGAKVTIWDVDKKFLEGIKISRISSYNRDHGLTD